MSFKLTEEEDEHCLIWAARKRDASGLQKNLKLSHIHADQEKAAQNKQVVRMVIQEKKTSADLLETAYSHSPVNELLTDSVAIR